MVKILFENYSYHGKDFDWNLLGKDFVLKLIIYGKDFN